MAEQRIDRFIEAMHRKQAQYLVFGTGDPVKIRVDGVDRVILDKPVRTDQIVALLEPLTAQLGGDQEFRYDSPTGPVSVQVRASGQRLHALIRPTEDAAPVAPSDEGLELMSNAAPMSAGAYGSAAGMAHSAPEVVGSAVEQPATAPPAVIAGVAESPPAPQAVPSEAAPARVPEAVAGEPQINRILRQLVQEGGSDLHLTSKQAPKFRKDGDIRDLPGWSVLDSDQIEGWMKEVAHEMARDQYYEVHDADFAHEIPGVARFRMNWFLDRCGSGAVMRTIPSKILTADQLGLPPVIRRFCQLPKGLVVVTGPTGSGKSTTLAAMVDLINKSRSDHIITIEDPVEFVHQSQKCLVNQREVHTHTKSFSAALRAALREDPDIVLVGEMRDLETVHIAIETAETGHLVFGTLHTNTAPSTVDRIIDQFPTDHQAQIRVMLSESLKGVVAQTLCKKIGGGRVACLEILVVNNAVSNLIRDGKTFQIPSIMQTAKGQGMLTQPDHMMQLVKEGKVAPHEAYAKAVDQQNMKQVLERAGYEIPSASG